MADHKASGSSEKKEASRDAICRFIRRLSPTKKYRSPVTASSSSTPGVSTGKQDASAKDSSSEKSLDESKMYLKLESKWSSSSSKSSLSSLSVPSPWVTPTQSNQSLDKISTEETKVLRQLHSNIRGATNLLEKYGSLERQKK